MASVAGALGIGGLIAIGTGVSLAGTIAGTLEQRKAGRRAERQQEKAQQTSQASASVQAARQRRRAIAEARIVQAQNRAVQGADLTTSTLSGVQSGLTSTLGGNISEQRANINNQLAIGGFQQNAANILRRGQERSDLFQAVGNTGFQSAISLAGTV